MSQVQPVQILRVRIEPDALRQVKEAKLNLCLIRGMTFDSARFLGNVVYRVIPHTELTTGVELSWDNRFEVFETNVFKFDQRVEMNIGPREVQFGQTATFNETSHKVEPVEGFDPSQPIYVQNYWKSGAHIGIKTINDSSFFISPPRVNGSWDTLKLSSEFGVVWDADLAPNIIFDIAKIAPFYFSFEPDVYEAKLSYQLKEKPYWRQWA